MKIKLATIRVGDVIEIDSGYDGESFMEPVTVIRIDQSIDFWDKALSSPLVTVKDSSGNVFNVVPELFS